MKQGKHDRSSREEMAQSGGSRHGGPGDKDTRGQQTDAGEREGGGGPRGGGNEQSVKRGGAGHGQTGGGPGNVGNH